MTKILAVALVVATLAGCASCPTNDYQCEAHRQWQANVMAAGMMNASNNYYQRAADLRAQAYNPQPIQTSNSHAIQPYLMQPTLTPSGEHYCTMIPDPEVPGVTKAVCWKR